MLEVLVLEVLSLDVVALALLSLEVILLDEEEAGGVTGSGFFW